MHAVAEVLGQLASEYFESFANQSFDCRVLVPGLTPQISRSLQEHLLDRPLSSYLVIPRQEKPDAEKKWMYADGLTSRREGSFVVVTWPGELAYIHDSIKGSGGTLRSIVFSDEWPWIDNGNESFRFNGPFIDRLLDIWGVASPDKAFFKEIIVEGLVKASTGSHDRASLLLDEIMGCFSTTLYPEISSTTDKLLFHSGIIKPQKGDRSTAQIVNDLAGLAETITKKYSEKNARGKYIEYANECFDGDPKKDLIIRSLPTFFDGIALGSTNYSSLLSLYRCWKHTGVEVWNTLDEKVLRKLFNYEPGTKRGKILLSIVPEMERVVADEQAKTWVTFTEDEFELRVDYDLGADFRKNGETKIQLIFNRKTVETKSFNDNSGSMSFSFDPSEYISQTGKQATLTARIVDSHHATGDSILAERRAKIHLCNDNSPCLVVVKPGMKVFSPGAEEPENVQVNEPATVYLVQANDDEEFIARLEDLDSNPYKLERVFTGCRKTIEALDPTQEASGEKYCEAIFPNHGTCVLVLEANDIVKGEFTLEDEFRVAILSKSRQKLSRLMDIFEGNTNELYNNLGKIGEKNRQLLTVSRSMEESQRCSLPVLFNPAVLNYQGVDVEERELYRLIGDCSLTITRSPLGDQVDGLINEYHSKKRALISFLKSQVNADLSTVQHPAYAIAPVYIALNEAVIENLLQEYLDIYNKIQDFLVVQRTSLSWAEAFSLCYLDCMVAWSNDAKGEFVLIGPWHPLVVTKRYFLQCEMLRFTKRLESGETLKGANALAALFSNFNAFKWLPGLHMEDVSYENIYLSSTNDPGWLLGIKARTDIQPDRLQQVISYMRQTLALEPDLMPEGSKYETKGYLQDFLKAFPTRRAVSLGVKHGHPAESVISSVKKLLHDDDQPTATGKKLPGGFHVVFENDPGDIEELDNIPKPPILVYLDRPQGGSSNRLPVDINLHSPVQKIGFSTLSSNMHSMPRGIEERVIFTAPLNRVSSGGAGVLASFSREIDNPEDVKETLSQAFRQAIGKVSSFFSVQYEASRSPGLPRVLESSWTVIPGLEIDPAVFVKYISDGIITGDQERALWDFNVDIDGSMNSYFILSQLPGNFGSVIAGSPLMEGKDQYKQIIRELGEVGIALGSEALKTGQKTLGALGVIAAIRLFKGCENVPPVLVNEPGKLGFLISVDSFRDFLGEKLDGQENENNKRADLVAIQLYVPMADDAPVQFSACAIECKYSSGIYPEGEVLGAIDQAAQTFSRLKGLFEGAKKKGGTPEMMAILRIVSHGLNVCTAMNPTLEETKRKALESILRGSCEFIEPVKNTILVSSEAGLSKEQAGIRTRNGYWVRLSPGNWPGVSSGEGLVNACDKLSKIFPLTEEGQSSEINSEEEGSSTPEVTYSPEEDSISVEMEEAANEGQNEDTCQNSNSVEFNEQTTERELEAIETEEPIFLGVNKDYKQVYFDPANSANPLATPHMMITGSSGKGKTQLIKTLVCNLRSQGKRVFLIDFKSSDFAGDQAFLNASRMTAQHVNFYGLPYNPLIPAPEKLPGTNDLCLQVGQHLNLISSVLAKTCRLGDQQEADLKRVMREAYREYGVSPHGAQPFVDDQEFPDFNDIGNSDLGTLARNRLDPLFDLGIFNSQYKQVSFEALLNDSIVLDLSAIQSDKIKSAIAKILVLSAHSYFNARKQKLKTGHYFVFDEAHRIMGTDYVASFVRECRAYGVGIVLASQYPTDFSDDIAGSLSTKIIHGNDADAARVTAIRNLLSLPIERDHEVANMGLFEAILDNNQYRKCFLRTLAFPQYLVYKELKENGPIQLEDLANRVPGVHEDKLEFTINLLLHMGIVEEFNGQLIIAEQTTTT